MGKLSRATSTDIANYFVEPLVDALERGRGLSFTQLEWENMMDNVHKELTKLIESIEMMEGV